MTETLTLSELWTPKPTQQAFLDAVAEAPEMGMVAYVGSLGSGKSWAVCRAAIGLALTYPGIKILLGRFHATDLEITTLQEFLKLIGHLETVTGQAQGRLHGAEYQRTYVFENGSLVLFRPLDEAEQKYRSLEIAVLGVDEASEVPLSDMMMLVGRLRQPGFPHVGFVVSNPTGHRHWLYDWFVRDPVPGYRLFRTNTSENLDNLPPNYVQSLERIYPPSWVQRYLRGEWGDLQEGVPVFPDFDPTVHVRDCSWSRNHPIHVGIDFGYHTPAAVWCQVTAKDQLTIIRSWCPRQIREADFAQGMLQRNDDWFPKGHFLYYGGHDGKQKDKAGKTSLQVFGGYGIFVRLRYTHIDSGLATIRTLLKVRSDDEPGILIDPANERGVEGFSGGYRYPAVKDETVPKPDPQKTGIFDPWFDALRYVSVCLFSPTGEQSSYPQPRAAFRRRRVTRAVA